MILIGEKLNSSIPSTMEIFQRKDDEGLIALIKKQEEAGAQFLDINAAICGEEELDRMLWAIELVKAHSQCGIMIDTADTAVMALAAKAANGRALILNSATITDRFDAVATISRETGAAVVGLPIDDGGMPETLEDKCAKIDLLVQKLRGADIADSHIFIDVLVETLATNGESARIAIGAAAYVSMAYPEIRTTCGLSNISFGLPRRGLINAAFLAAAYSAGLSSAIIDPTSPAMRDMLAAAKVVAGQDEYCMEFITYVRGDN